MDDIVMGMMSPNFKPNTYENMIGQLFCTNFRKMVVPSKLVFVFIQVKEVIYGFMISPIMACCSSPNNPGELG